MDLPNRLRDFLLLMFRLIVLPFKGITLHGRRPLGKELGLPFLSAAFKAPLLAFELDCKVDTFVVVSWKEMVRRGEEDATTTLLLLLLYW